MQLLSTWLMWRGDVRKALIAGFVRAVVASAVLVDRDLSRIRATGRGRYVLQHMPPSAQAVRLLGQTVAWQAAYRERPAGIVLGAVIVPVGWSHGLFAPGPARSRGVTRNLPSPPPNRAAPGLSDPPDGGRRLPARTGWRVRPRAGTRFGLAFGAPAVDDVGVGA